MTTVHWLGGWASSLACWESLLLGAFPQFGHRFLDSHDWLDATPEKAGLAGLPEGDVVAAWSMGTLLAHRWMERGLWPSAAPLLSLCPVFDFTGGGYGEPVILRMEEKLAADREAVLRDFWRRMPKSKDVPGVWRENWIRAALQYEHGQLLRGLEFLRHTRVAPASLPSPGRWELLAGDQDRLSPAGKWKDVLPPPALVTVYSGGHLPFWECPDQIQSILLRLSGG